MVDALVLALSPSGTVDQGPLRLKCLTLPLTLILTLGQGPLRCK